MKPLITIDPGANGGICLQYRDEFQEITDICCYKIPVSLVDLAALLTALRRKVPEELRAILEDVGFHRQGSAAQGSVKLARHVGQLEGILMLLDIPCEYVRPQDWMQAFPDRPKSMTIKRLKSLHPAFTVAQLKTRLAKVNAQRKKDRKAYIKAKVQEAFPNVELYSNPTKPRRQYRAYPKWAGDVLGILLWARR
jgi:hypothetical protein